MHVSVGRHFVGLRLCLVHACDAGTPKLDCIIDLELLDRGDSVHCALQSAKPGLAGQLLLLVCIGCSCFHEKRLQRAV